MFPARADASVCFNAEARCLIDMGNVFIVMPQGDNLQPYQRSIFRLEVQRQNVELADDSRLSKDACLALLKAKFDQLPYCDIFGVNFPFFAQGEVGEGQNKHRPCVALYGDDDQVPMYIGVYTGAPTDVMAAAKDNQFCLLLKPSTDVLPPTASNQMVVDCAKVCSFPNLYNLPDDYLNGMPTWKKYLSDPSKHESVLSNHLRPANPQSLRNEIIKKMIAILIANPIFDYRDRTLELDIGTMVKGRKLREGEWRNFKKVYEGPPKLSAAGLPPAPEKKELSLETELSPTPTKKGLPRTPQ
ncbi:expressed unknown protein [Seminavis robusta]|uniref:Uncharacterized protein n=1 Tax=Seminavis robusta TaxID=568900 RepID=A0A9N8F0B2_9STRA|nr:expressed unknown protein [Seminavis robusta]|eukprot:Sro2193_g318470.1 n/a (300) ;mRNA; f:6163-7062